MATLETWKRRLEEAPFSEKERKLFTQFVGAAMSKRHPAGARRIEKYLSDLITTRRLAKTTFEHLATMPGFKKAIEAINASTRHKFRTKLDLKRIAAQYAFYFISGRKEAGLKYAPREIKELAAHDAKPSDKRLAREIITRPEMRELLTAANTQDKAIISCLFDSGMRIGEFIQLKKSDLTFSADGCDVKVPAGKTGERKVVVIEATKYLQRWLEDEHPDKAAGASLWLSQETYQHSPLQGPAIARRIKEVKARLNARRKKAGLPPLNKDVNPHNFRHSRATELGAEPGMTEQLLCKFFGWEIGSDMPRTYLHITDAQVRRAVLSVHGKAKQETPREIITHTVCRACQEQNPIGVNFCGRCGQPVNSDEKITRVAELEERLKIIEKAMERRVVGDVVDAVVKKKAGGKS